MRCLAIDVTCTTNLGYNFGFVDTRDFERDMFNFARTLGRMNMISRHIGHWFFGVMRAPARWAKRAEPASPAMVRVLHFRNVSLSCSSLPNLLHLTWIVSFQWIVDRQERRRPVFGNNDGFIYVWKGHYCRRKDSIPIYC